MASHELATSASLPEAGHFSAAAAFTPHFLLPLLGQIPIHLCSNSDPVSLLSRLSLGKTPFCCRERRFLDSLRNALWQVDFLRTCVSDTVFITLTLVLWSARYKLLNWLDIGKGSLQGRLARHSATGLGAQSSHVTCFYLRKLLDFSD